MKKMRTKSLVIVYGVLFFLFLVELIPILQVFLNSFRKDAEVKNMPFGLPKEWVLVNWPETWQMGGYGIAYINSLITAAVVISLVLCIVGLGAYALSKLQFRGRGFFTAYFFVAISLPGFLYIVPDYFLFNRLGLVNTRFALILIYTAGNIPFNMLLLRTFLGSIPRELEEAAKIDGCTELSVFIRITVPIAKTIFLTIAILIFVSCWNEFLWANTFIANEALKPVSTRYVKFVGQYSSNMARIYTASAITILPIIVLYILFSRRFIEGMTSGSVKG
jgi:raffinose/stachyose/melibiose transport system permease protein